MKIEFNIDNRNNHNGIVAAYMRYSSTNQDEKSIEYQRSAITLYAIGKGYYISTEYIDEARTGTNDRREGFQELLKDAKTNHCWNKILVYDMSRFSRNNIDATKYAAELEDLDIEIISVTQGFDNSNEGFLSRGIVNLLNEYYSRNLAKHTHAGLKQKAQTGKHCGGVAPLGYDVTNERLTINEGEAEIVRLIFDLFEANYSYKRMADELNKRGYRTKSGNTFNKNSFSSILRQDKYIGTYTWNKTRKKNNQGRRNSHKYKSVEEQVIMPNFIPPIIEKEQFNRVQDMLAERQGGNAQSKSRHYYLLSSLNKLKCAECGANLIGTRRKSHDILYSYYYCPNHKRHSCSVKEIRADYLDKFVINAVVNDISRREDLIEVFNNTDEKDRIKVLKTKLDGLNKASRNILKSLRYSADKELTGELRHISEEKEIVQAELDTLNKSQQTITEQDRKSICKKIAKMMLTSESFEVKKYLSVVIDSIIVSNENIELSLNIA